MFDFSGRQVGRLLSFLRKLWWIVPVGAMVYSVKMISEQEGGWRAAGPQDILVASALIGFCAVAIWMAIVTLKETWKTLEVIPDLLKTVGALSFAAVSVATFGRACFDPAVARPLLRIFNINHVDFLPTTAQTLAASGWQAVFVVSGMIVFFDRFLEGQGITGLSLPRPHLSIPSPLRGRRGLQMPQGMRPQAGQPAQTQAPRQPVQGTPMGTPAAAAATTGGGRYGD